MNRPLPATDLFARLVGFDTTSSKSNLALVDFLAAYLDRPGVEIWRLPSADGRKANLLARVGPPVDAERRGLVLSGHMDVVPAGEGWSCDPFTLTDRGERWLGRGTADMKGFLALAIDAVARAAAGTRPLAAPLVLLLTYDEELGGLGACRLAESWPRERLLPRATVIGEPTELAAVRMHKGHVRLRLSVTGTSAHSGYPHLGVNAIEAATPILAALSALRAELAGERPEHSRHFGQTPYVALNIARVDGGGAINVVPERCVIDVGMRPLPGMRGAPLVERLEAAVERVAPAGRWDLEVLDELPPLLLAETAPIYRAVAEQLGQRETVAASYGTDAGWLQHLDLDCVICGPGSIEVAHKPDEYLAKADFAAGARFVERLTERFCYAGGG